MNESAPPGQQAAPRTDGDWPLDDIASHAEIQCGLEYAAPSDRQVEQVLAVCRDKKPLDIEQTAVLIAAQTPEQLAAIFATASQVKEAIYGRRIVLFAPLYVGNLCVNDCAYCAFKRSNRYASRLSLDTKQLEAEVRALQSQGHKRLILVFGEHPLYDAEAIASTVRQVYAIRHHERRADERVVRGAIRRVNINAAPLSVSGFATVHEAGIGTYQVFQETYHRPTYARYHPARTPKGDYEGRLRALDRAMAGGVDDVGLGALFGLYDWRYDVLGLVSHARHLVRRFGVGPHTISVPRLRPALGVTVDDAYAVDDAAFKRVIAILRLAVPYAGLILTAREEVGIRREAMRLGVSQIDGGTRIDLGGYASAVRQRCAAAEQFSGDTRSLSEVMQDLLRDGYLPSFCTACYRAGRTGEHFMEFAVPGFIKRYCTPNALFTLREYLLDYGGEDERRLGDALIEAGIGEIDAALQGRVRAALQRVDDGKRDVRW